MSRSIFNFPIEKNSVVYKGETWGEFSTILFEVEKEYNTKIFNNSHESFKLQFPELCETLNSRFPELPLFSTERMLSALRACTHDLLRYATYHGIGFLEKQRRYDIAPAVRASVYAKWIANFRPYNFDCVSCEVFSKSANMAVRCNEFASNIYASHALELRDNEGLMYIDEVLGVRELETYLYTLRYRIKHQDSYSLFSRRISESFR